eukprot:jgi/Chlat1/206/Chrsp1S03035
MADRGRKAMPVGNAICYQKWLDHCQKIHKQKLAAITPSIDNSPPQEFAHLYTRTKKHRIMEDRFEQIEYENRILLEKMERISQQAWLEICAVPACKHVSTQDVRRCVSPLRFRTSLQLRPGYCLDACQTPQIDSYQARPPGYRDSLNSGKRRQQLERIHAENLAMLSRIQEAGPVYSIHKWEEEDVRRCVSPLRFRTSLQLRPGYCLDACQTPQIDSYQARPPGYRDSLNSGKRRQQLERIHAENLAMLSRIQEAGPVYSIHKWEEEYKNSEQYRRRVRTSPERGRGTPHTDPLYGLYGLSRRGTPTSSTQLPPRASTAPGWGRSQLDSESSFPRPSPHHPHHPHTPPPRRESRSAQAGRFAGGLRRDEEEEEEEEFEVERERERGMFEGAGAEGRPRSVGGKGQGRAGGGKRRPTTRDVFAGRSSTPPHTAKMAWPEMGSQPPTHPSDSSPFPPRPPSRASRRPTPSPTPPPTTTTHAAAGMQAVRFTHNDAFEEEDEEYDAESARKVSAIAGRVSRPGSASHNRAGLSVSLNDDSRDTLTTATTTTTLASTTLTTTTLDTHTATTVSVSASDLSTTDNDNDNDNNTDLAASVSTPSTSSTLSSSLPREAAVFSSSTTQTLSRGVPVPPLDLGKTPAYQVGHDDQTQPDNDDHLGDDKHDAKEEEEAYGLAEEAQAFFDEVAGEEEFLGGEEAAVAEAAFDYDYGDYDYGHGADEAAASPYAAAEGELLQEEEEHLDNANDNNNDDSIHIEEEEAFTDDGVLKEEQVSAEQQQQHSDTILSETLEGDLLSGGSSTEREVGAVLGDVVDSMVSAREGDGQEGQLDSSAVDGDDDRLDGNDGKEGEDAVVDDGDVRESEEAVYDMHAQGLPSHLERNIMSEDGQELTNPNKDTWTHASALQQAVDNTEDEYNDHHNNKSSSNHSARSSVVSAEVDALVDQLAGEWA